MAPAHPGLPSSDELRQLHIWDSYFTPSFSHPGKDGRQRLFADIGRSLPAISLAHIERLCLFPHVGVGTTTDNELERQLKLKPELVLKPFEQWPGQFIGMIQLNANRVNASLDALNRWLRDGPMVGVYFPGGGPGACTCTHPNSDRLVDRIQQLGGLIMQHTWFKTGGKTGPGESTPAELALLAKRYPEQLFICAHAGGQWQHGVRAVRNTRNVWIETSGFDATAGFLEMAVRELTAERIVFGSHLPSRSLGTELGKVIGAQISHEDQKKILGENYRRALGWKGRLPKG